MNKRILVFTVALLAVAMLATPVLAIGPQNVVNNPNAQFPLYGVALELPSGINHEWVNGLNKHLMYMDARDFQIGNAFVITDVSQVAGLENEWVYFSAVRWGDWLCFVFGAQPGSQMWTNLHMYALQNNPEGVYYREVLVGK